MERLYGLEAANYRKFLDALKPGDLVAVVDARHHKYSKTAYGYPNFDDRPDHGGPWGWHVGRVTGRTSTTIRAEFRRYEGGPLFDRGFGCASGGLVYCGSPQLDALPVSFPLERAEAILRGGASELRGGKGGDQ